MPGSAFQQQPVVSLRDVGGNIITTDSTSVVTAKQVGGFLVWLELSFGRGLKKPYAYAYYPYAYAYADASPPPPSPLT